MRGGVAAHQATSSTVRGDDAVDGDLDMLATGGRPTAPVSDEQAPPQHTSRPSKKDSAVPTIKWDNLDDSGAENLGTSLAVGSPAWLDDFLNHLGQTELQRNPNAGIRVRVPVAAGHLP